jgi:putative ABC transport system permease protein
MMGITLTYGITMVPIFMSSIWNNIFQIQYGEFQRMEYNVDFAHPMTNNVLRELSHIVDIEHIEPKVEMPFELVNGWKKKVVSVIGVHRDTEFYHFSNRSGETIHLSSNSIILSDRLADSLGVKAGDEIILKNFMPDTEDETLIVKDVIEQYLGSNAYLDIDTMQRVLGEQGLITGALLNSQDEVVQKLQDIKNIGQVQSVQDMKNTFLEFMDLMIYSVGILMLFGGVLGFAIVYNVSIISIGERIMEFSSLRVMGFDKKEIYKMMTRENAVMTFFGIILGIPFGYLLCANMISSLAMDMVTIPLIIEPNSYVYAGLATVLFVSLAQLATIRRIYGLNFMDALKNRAS